MLKNSLWIFFIIFCKIVRMSKVDIKVVVKEGVNLPVYKTSGSAGCDVCAYLTEDVVLKKGMRKLIPTGIFMEIPSG